MPSSTPLPHQRELLRAFRQAAAQRAQVETDAEARRKTASESTDATLNQARHSACLSGAT